MMSEDQVDSGNEALEYPELPIELSQPRFSTLFKYFGPGAIIASITIGSGETVFASRSGAVFGYSLLWLFLAAAIAKGLQIYCGSRYITLTGEHPLRSWNRLPLLRGWFPWMIAGISILCFPLWLGGLPPMLGQLVNWIVGIPDGTAFADEKLAAIADESFQFWVKIWGTAFVLVAVSITLLQSYKLLEKVQTLLVGLLLLSLLAAAMASSPDFMAIITGTFIPSLPDFPKWADKFEFAQLPKYQEIALYVGAMGGGTQDYLGYVGILREKGWGLMKRFNLYNPAYGDGPVALPSDPAQVRRGLGWLRAPAIDVTVSFLCIVIFTYAFIILGAEILHPQEKAPDGNKLLTEQKDFLGGIHSSLTYLYQVGVFMAFFGTIYGAFEIYTRTGHEALTALIPKLDKTPVSKVRPWILLYCGGGALAVMWTGFKPVEIVTPAAIFGSVITCGLWCLAGVYAERKLLPAAYRMRSLLAALVVLAGLFLTGLGLAAAWQYFFPGS
jgi:Mn2+/Fe2+ NRAMP family transporter